MCGKNRITEYEEGNAAVREFDKRSWTVAAIYIPISLGLLGVSFTQEIVTQDTLALPILAASSLLLYFTYLIIDWRHSYFSQILYRRLQSIEEDLGMCLHRKIEAKDREYRNSRWQWKLQVRRIRTWIRLLFLILTVMWIVRLDQLLLLFPFALILISALLYSLKKLNKTSEQGNEKEATPS